MPKIKDSTTKKTAAFNVPEPKLTWLANKTFELEITILTSETDKAYQDALKKLATSLKVDGFRQGKVPLNIAEKKIDKSRIYQEIVNLLLPQSYRLAIQKHHLRPIIDPKVKVITMEEGKNWQFGVSACEAPDIKLVDYKKIVRDITAKDKIWIPGKTIDKKEESENKAKKLGEILEALLKDMKIELSDLLIESEKNRMLARLLDQIQRLGLTIEQYAQANHKTIADIQNEYETISKRNLTTEFLLNAITIEEKIAVTDDEVKIYLDQVKDSTLKDKLSSAEQQTYLKMTLIRQKTIDFLLSL